MNVLSKIVAQRRSRIARVGHSMDVDLPAVREPHAELVLDVSPVTSHGLRGVVGEPAEVEALVRARRDAAAPGREQRRRAGELDRDVVGDEAGRAHVVSSGGSGSRVRWAYSKWARPPAYSVVTWAQPPT